MSADQRESQLSAMFDGELPDTECELLARRLSRDAALKRQWARYALIGAVVRDEPLRLRRDPGGQLAAGIAVRLVTALDAELPQSVGAEAHGAAAPPVAPAGRGSMRWARPAAGLAIAAGVAALSVVWLQGRAPGAVPSVAALGAVASAPSTMMTAAETPLAAGEIEVIAPPAETRGARAEIVVAGNGYPAPPDRGLGSGEPESYVVPMPAARVGAGPPAQLANYVVVHSEFSAPLSRRSLLSALVASDAAPVPSAAPVLPSRGTAAAGVDPQVAADAAAAPGASEARP